MSRSLPNADPIAAVSALRVKVQRSPMGRLLLAILADAVEGLGERARVPRLEAAWWVFFGDREEAFSFARCCEVLDLHETWLRCGLAVRYAEKFGLVDYGACAQAAAKASLAFHPVCQHPGCGIPLAVKEYGRTRKWCAPHADERSHMRSRTWRRRDRRRAQAPAPVAA